MIEEAITQAIEIFNELTAKFKDVKWNETGLSRSEAFLAIYSEACKNYRSLQIEENRQQRQQESKDEPITEKQINYLKYLAEKQQNAMDIMAHYIIEHKKENVKELTKSEASELIEKIKGAKQ